METCKGLTWRHAVGLTWRHAGGGNMETCRQAGGGRKTWRHAWVGNMETCRQAGGGRKTWRHAGKLRVGGKHGDMLG